MKEDIKLQELIDKCLHDEASEVEKLELKKILDESPQAFEAYLQAIEQHGEFREWAETYVEEKKPKKRVLHFGAWLAAAAAIVLAFLLIKPSAPNGLQLLVNSQSRNFKVIRQGKAIRESVILKKGDQIIVGSEG